MEIFGEVNEMEEVSYLRQHAIFNPEESHKQIVVIGAGGIGSFLVFELAKMGFQNITVFDGDEVEAHNVPNQLFGMQHVGKKKTEALAGIVKALTGVDINQRGEFLETISDLPMGDIIYVFALDSLEVRQKLYEQMKGLPNKLVDGRMGGEGYQSYVIDLGNESDQKRYEKELYVEAGEEPCGQRAIIYTLISLTSEMTNIIKRIDAKQKVPFSITRHMSKHFFLAGD